MEMYFFLILSTIAIVFVIGAPNVNDEICGDPDKERSDCKYDCRKRCLTYASEVDMENKSVIADLALKVNLCVSKCSGNGYNPRLLLANLTKVENGPMDPNWHWTSFSDIQKCLGLCAFPTPDKCLKGYLSAFLYCDCDTCCKQIVDRVKSQLCIVGCHDWFLRQWSPKRNQSCRFPAGYSKTPDAWCEGFCSWIMLRKSVATMDNLNISTPVGQKCMKTCKDRIRQNKRVDYDTVDSLCTDPWKCLTVQVNGFQITTLLNDNKIIESHRLIDKDYFGTNEQVTTATGQKSGVVSTETRHGCGVFADNHKFPPALQTMKDNGVQTGVEPGAHDNVKVPQDPFGFLPKPVVGPQIAQFHDGRVLDYSLGHIFRDISLKQTECTKSIWRIHCNWIARLDLEYDVTLKISESIGFVPALTADQIKSFVAEKYPSLKYERTAGDYILYTATGGKIRVTYKDIPKAKLESCVKQPGCKGGPDKPNCQCEGKSCP